MIYGLFIAAVLALIVATAFALAYKVRSEEWEEKYWEENRLHLDTKTSLERELKQSNDELKQCMASFREVSELYEVAQKIILERFTPNQSANDPEGNANEHGTYVVHRNLKPATPDLYRVVFELDVNGQRVLEDLTKRFNRHAFVSDSQGGERETCRRLGQSEPVNFILSQINKANDPNYSEVENDA